MLQMSNAGLARLSTPDKTSGAMYNNDPASLLSAPAPTANIPAMPKSTILIKLLLSSENKSPIKAE